jgi:hypothetical protein
MYFALVEGGRGHSRQISALINRAINSFRKFKENEYERVAYYNTHSRIRTLLIGLLDAELRFTAARAR